jgi:hypothetical protein
MGEKLVVMGGLVLTGFCLAIGFSLGQDLYNGVTNAITGQIPNPNKVGLVPDADDVSAATNASQNQHHHHHNQGA